MTAPRQVLAGPYGHDVSGPTAYRPAVTAPGEQYFDTDLGQMLTSDGAGNWIIAPDVGYLDDSRLGRVLKKQDIGAQPYWYFNPGDPRQFQFMNWAQFTATPGDPYLSATASADFDFSSTNQFSIVIVRSPHWDQSSSQNGVSGGNQTSVQTGYCGCWNANSASSYLLASGGSNHQGNNLQLNIATNASGSTLASATTANDNTAQYPCGTPFDVGVAVFDGTQGTAANRITLYKDTTQFSNGGSNLTVSGTIPANPQSAAALPFNIGGGFGSIYTWRHYGGMRLVMVFKGRLLSQSDVNALVAAIKLNYTFKDLINNATISFTGLKAVWDLRELAGEIRYDASGNGHHASETGGTVQGMVTVNQAKTLDRHAFSMYAPAVPNSLTDFVGNKYLPAMQSAQPEYIASSPMNGQPAIRLRGLRTLYASGFNPFNTTACEVFQALYLNELAQAESFVFMTAGEIPGKIAYWGAGFSQAQVATGAWLRFRAPDYSGGVNGNIYGNLVWPNATPLLSTWRVFGSGGAASYEHWLNAVKDTLTYGLSQIQNTGPATVQPRENVSLGSLIRSGEEGGPNIAAQDYYLGESIMLPALSTTQQQAIRDYMRTQYGTT